MASDLVVLNPIHGHPCSQHSDRLIDFAVEQGVDVERWDGSGTAPESRAILVEFCGTFPDRYAPALRQIDSSRIPRVSVYVYTPWRNPTRRPSRLLSPARRVLERLRRRATTCLAPVRRWCDWLDAEYVPVGPTTVRSHIVTPGPFEFPWVVVDPDDDNLLRSWITDQIPASELRTTTYATPVDETAMPAPFLQLTRENAAEVMGRACALLRPLRTGAHAGDGTLMNAAALGLPVLSTRGPLFDPVWERSPLRLCGSPGEFAEELLWIQQEPRLDEFSQAWILENFRPEDLDRRTLELALG